MAIKSADERSAFLSLESLIACAPLRLPVCNRRIVFVGYVSILINLQLTTFRAAVIMYQLLYACRQPVVIQTSTLTTSPKRAAQQPTQLACQLVSKSPDRSGLEAQVAPRRRREIVGETVGATRVGECGGRARARWPFPRRASSLAVACRRSPSLAIGNRTRPRAVYRNISF